MDCACVYIGDYDCAELHSRRMVKARKIHKCEECNREIQPGEEYEYVTAKWYGAFETMKTCQDCLSIREVFFCEGWVYSGMMEHLTEHIQEMNGKISSECLNAVTPRARELVIDLIDEEWERTLDEDEPEEE